MVGGFPPRRPAPAKIAEVPTVAPEAVEFDEDGRRYITAPVVPAPTRPPPTYARPLPPMSTAPKPLGLPAPPMAPPVKPTVRRAEPFQPPPKAATPAPAAVKRTPPPTPYVRKPAQYLDPNDIPYDRPASWGKR